MKEYSFNIGGKDFNVAINDIKNGVANVTVNGKNYSVSGCDEQASCSPLNLSASQTPPKGPLPLMMPRVAQNSGGTAAPASSSHPETASGSAVKSPLPGVVISVDVKEGQSVKRGQKVAVIEAMKMENEILAPKDGVIGSIGVSKGDSVLEGATICTVE